MPKPQPSESEILRHFDIILAQDVASAVVVSRMLNALIINDHY